MKNQDPSSFVFELAKVEKNFHFLINDRTKLFMVNRPQEMPSLKEHFEGERYFPVDGMYGGFSYRFKPEIGGLKLIVESWSRVVEGSTLVHEVSSSGYVETT